MDKFTNVCKISDLDVQFTLFLREPQPKRAETKSRTHSEIQEVTMTMKAIKWPCDPCSLVSLIRLTLTKGNAAAVMGLIEIPPVSLIHLLTSWSMAAHLRELPQTLIHYSYIQCLWQEDENVTDDMSNVIYQTVGTHIQ